MCNYRYSQLILLGQRAHDLPMTEAEQILLAGCIRGDKTAWNSFVIQYSKLVYYTVRKTLTLHNAECRDELLDDLYQELFVSLLQNDCRKLAQFRGDGGCTLASWLSVVTSRLTIDRLRKEKSARVAISETLFSAQPTDEPLIDPDQEKTVITALEKLTPRERLMIHLHFRQGLGADEIAVILKTSVGAVHTQKSRLLAKLREILGQIPSL